MLVVVSTAPLAEAGQKITASIGTIEIELPDSSREMVSLLGEHSLEIQALIERGQLDAVYVPAMLSKEIALAIEARIGRLPTHQRVNASGAIRRLVLAAWRLDAYGDLGDRQKVVEAYGRFASAINSIRDACVDLP